MSELTNYAPMNLKELRGTSGMSRNDLLRELESRGVSMHATTLRRIEEAQQQMKVDELLAFCDVFEISLDDFVANPIDQVSAQLSEILQELKRDRSSVGFYLSNYIYTLEKAQKVLNEKETPSPVQNSTVKLIAQIVENDNAAKPAMNQVMDAVHSEKFNNSNGKG